MRTQLAAPLALCRGHAVILIKPQFEVGRDHIGRGGLVTDQAAIARAVARVIDFLALQGFAHRMSLPAPISGGDGNTEIVAVFARS